MGDRDSVAEILEEVAQPIILWVTIIVEARRQMSTSAYKPSGGLQDTPEFHQATNDGSRLHHDSRHQARCEKQDDTSELLTGPCHSSEHGSAQGRSPEQMIKALDNPFTLNLASCLRSSASFGPHDYACR